MSQPPAPSTTPPAPPLPPWAVDLENHALVPYLSFIEQISRKKLLLTDSNYLNNMAMATEKLAVRSPSMFVLFVLFVLFCLLSFSLSLVFIFNNRFFISL